MKHGKFYVRPTIKSHPTHLASQFMAASVEERIKHDVMTFEDLPEGNITVDSYNDGGSQELWFGSSSSESKSRGSGNGLWGLIVFFLSFGALMSCSENDTVVDSSANGRSIAFNIGMDQKWEKSSAGPKKSPILPHRTMQMQTARGVAYMHESASPGIQDYRQLEAVELMPADDANPTVRANRPRRAKPVESVSEMSSNGFSSFAYKAGDGSLFYSNIQSDKNGQLAQRVLWPEGESLRFYAVHPYDATTGNFGGNANGPTYNFTVNSDVSQQVDFMYASTGVLSYNEEQLAPLNFRHGLTAIQFTLGTAPDFGQNITSVTLKNVNTTGTYTLPSASTADAQSPAEGVWSALGTPLDITLDGLNVATTGNPNAAITSPQQTFLMLPCADLSGVGVQIGFADGTSMTYTFTSGAWLAGYTYTYQLSKEPEQWNYVLTTYGDYNNDYRYDLEYTDDVTGYYCLVKSYKELNGNIEAVPWEVVEYEYSDDDGATWVSTGKTMPAWLDDFPEAGSGVTNTTGWQGGYAYLNVEDYIGESVSAVDQQLQQNPAKSDWDLSTHNVKGEVTPMNTANCYVISSPGTYKLPLVYGNAISNGATNTVAYNPTAGGLAGFTMLKPFLNYKGNGITDPWLKTDGTPTTAELLWTDSKSLFDLLEGNVGINGDYMTIDASTANLLREGNAVVAVKDADGVIMWSWHLWFAPDDVLDEIYVENRKERLSARKNYYFTKQTLGAVGAHTFGSTYNSPRCLRVRIQQTEGNGEPLYGYIRIRQNNGGITTPAHYTLYQFGRKDAMPGYTLKGESTSGQKSQVWPDGGFVHNGTGRVDYATSIQHPNVFYTRTDLSNTHWCSTNYNNPWSAQNTQSGKDWEYVYKTVYDPSPAGFHVPNPVAMLSLCYDSNTSNYSGTVSGHSNISGDWADGLYFYTTSAKDATIFFPAGGMRSSSSGEFNRGYAPQGTNSGKFTGYYWATSVHNTNTAMYLNIGYQFLFGGDGYVTSSVEAAHAFLVRPVK